MTALLPLLNTDIKRIDYLQAIAELHRELGQFDEAKEAVKALIGDEDRSTARLIAQLADEHEPAVVRFTL